MSSSGNGTSSDALSISGELRCDATAILVASRGFSLETQALMQSNRSSRGKRKIGPRWEREILGNDVSFYLFISSAHSPSFM